MALFGNIVFPNRRN